MEKKETAISPVNMEERKSKDIRAGDSVRVWQKIVDGDKTRLQAFEGLVLAKKHGKEAGSTFTVRRVSSGVGIEKIFPLYSPLIDSIEILKRSKVRQAKLYHIRKKAAKEISRQMRRELNTPDQDERDEMSRVQKEEALKADKKEEKTEEKK